MAPLVKGVSWHTLHEANRKSNTKMLVDGYTRHCTIKGKGVWYRPALAGERVHLRHVCGGLGDESATEFMCRWLASRVEAWDYSVRVDGYALESLYCSDEESFGQLAKAVQGLVKDGSGEVWRDIEVEYRDNLYDGVLLELTNPRLARRDCVACKRDWYNEETGLPILGADSLPILRDGPTLCETSGCAKGTPEKQKSLNKANRWAWRHFQDCEAIGVFPDDPIVKRNAATIRRALRRHGYQRHTVAK